MGLAEILVILGILFLLVLIIAPVYYYFNREKYQDEADEDAGDAGQEE